MHDNKSIKHGGTLSFLLFLMFLISLICATTIALGEETSIVIDVSSSLVESETNFTVSVYDPDIQLGTPYLVNVTILFDDTFHQITPQHENGEIYLTAPKVLVNKTYLLEAFTENKNGNRTITVIPSQNHELTELVITPDTYSVKALKEFSVIVTDKNGQPIENATVSIQNANSDENHAKTDENGRAWITAPNKNTIILLAQKTGYKGAEETLWVTIQKDTFNEFLSQPSTPIILSFIVLISVIIYVTFSNKNIKKTIFTGTHHKDNQMKQDSQNKEQSTESSFLHQTTKHRKNTEEHHVEEIYIQTKPHEKVIHVNRNHQRKQPGSFKWFHATKDASKEHKQNLKQKKDTWIQGTDDIHKKIDKVLEKQEKRKNKNLMHT